MKGRGKRERHSDEREEEREGHRYMYVWGLSEGIVMSWYVLLM